MLYHYIVEYWKCSQYYINECALQNKHPWQVDNSDLCHFLLYRAIILQAVFNIMIKFVTMNSLLLLSIRLNYLIRQWQWQCFSQWNCFYDNTRAIATQQCKINKNSYFYVFWSVILKCVHCMSETIVYNSSQESFALVSFVVDRYWPTSCKITRFFMALSQRQ